jgi:hypothetical protein
LICFVVRLAWIGIVWRNNPAEVLVKIRDECIAKVASVANLDEMELIYSGVKLNVSSYAEAEFSTFVILGDCFSRDLSLRNPSTGFSPKSRFKM